MGSIGLPKDRLLLPADWRASESCLGSTPNGRLILVYRQRLRVSVLVLSAGGDRERHMEVDTETTVQSLLAPRGQGMLLRLELESCGDQRTGALLMQLHALVGRSSGAGAG